MADPIVPNVVVSMPSQNFTLARSFKAAANGKVYIGKIDTDPTIPENQIQVYVQNEDDTLVPIAQPIIINTGGYPVYGGQISKFVTVEGHSMAVYDAYNVQQFYFPNVLKYDPDMLRTDLAQPDGVDLVSNAADQRVLSSPDGWDYVSASLQTVHSRSTEDASIFDYIDNPTDFNNLKNSAGVEVDVSAYLTSAVASGLMAIRFPPVVGVYTAENVSLPLGFVIKGWSRRPYTVNDNSSFNGAGTVIRLKAGATRMFSLGGRNTFDSVVLDGRDRSVSFMQGTSQMAGCRFVNCGLYRWNNAFGGVSAANYIGTLYATGCNVSGNNTGFYNLIDARIVDCVVNANVLRGVSLLTGANSNSFVGVRNEWNGSENWYAFGSRDNVVTGEICDRAGLAGFAALGGALWTISGVAVRRSGRFAEPGSRDNAHFRVEDGSQIILAGVITSTGRNDDGTGNVSPENTIRTFGTTTGMKIVAAGCVLSGSTGTPFLQSVVPQFKSIVGCQGITDSRNVDYKQTASGVDSIGPVVGSVNLPAGGTTTITLLRPTVVQYSNTPSDHIALKIIARDATAGSKEVYRVPLLFRNEIAGVALVTLIESQQSSYPNTSGWGPSGTLVTVTVSVSNDGGTLSVVLVSKDGKVRDICAQLCEV